jgi:ribosome-associated translation inhibitor RaiA
LVNSINVSISGLEDADYFTKSRVHEEAGHLLEKVRRFLEVTSFEMHVRTYHKEGKRKKFSVHARLLTGSGEFFAEEAEWNLGKAVSRVLEKLESEAVRKEEKGRNR